MPQDIALAENFGDLLDARVREIHDQTYKEATTESMIDMIYRKETSDRNYEITSGLGGMSDLQDFDGTISFDNISQLYDTTFTFPEKALGFKVERKLYDDDLFGVMDQRPWQMAVSRARTREKTAVSPFNYAFIGTTAGTSQTGGDGQPWCSASHPYSPDDANTQSNAGSTALSATSVEATRRIGFNGIYNDRGEILDINYDLIICGVNNEQKAWEIIESAGKVDTADNNRNFHQGRYKLAVWRRLTSSTNWFFADSMLLKRFLYWWDRVDDGIKMDSDSNTLVAKWYTYVRYCAGAASWQPIYGHNV